MINIEKLSPGTVVHFPSDPEVKEWELGYKKGEGGMSVVYEVFPKGPSTITSIPRVIKIYRSKQHALTLAKEIKHIRKAKLECIPEIVAYGANSQFQIPGTEQKSKEYPCLIQAMCNGEGLDRWLNNESKKPANDDILEFLDRLVEVISEIHGKGFVHRDLKPANIFPDLHFSGSGINIIDFNSMVSSGNNPDSSTAGQTGIFKPPDFLQSDKADFRSDVYAFAVIALHCILWKSESHTQNSSEIKEMMKNLSSLVNRGIQIVLTWCLQLKIESGAELKQLWEEVRKTYSTKKSSNSKDIYSTLFALASNTENSIVSQHRTTLLQELYYCPTNIEKILKEVIENRIKKGPSADLPDLIVLSGHAGDGKSQLISRIETYVNEFKKGGIEALYDATHAESKNTPSVEVLDNWLMAGGFSDLRKRRKSKPRIVALNTGVAYSFFKNRETHYKNIKKTIHGQLGFLSNFDVSKDNEWRVWVIDLDLQRLVRYQDESGERLLDQMFDKLDPDNEDSIFDQKKLP